MRVVNVSSLKGDEILGKQLFDDTGKILINSNVKLSRFFIDKLTSMGVKSVYIDDEISKEIVIDDTVSEKTRQMSKYNLKEAIERYGKNSRTDNSDIVKSVNSIIDEMFLNRDGLIDITDIRVGGNTVFSHSVNVCILSSFIGIHLGYNTLKLKDISIGAILHDIGKIIILNDKKALSNFTSKEDADIYIQSMHPRIGYDFLGKENFCNTHSKIAVLMHHENIDGTGYPLKLKGDEISDIARLVSVCDVFDNLISGNGKEPPKLVYEALNDINRMIGHRFDEEIVKIFTMNIASYPSGTGVILNSNEKCLVVRQNKSMPMRPIVKVLVDKSGKPVVEPYEIDLLKEPAVFIKGDCQF
ncbi:HD-GYP domain-containing protein [Pseudobacteroides cellulosolvens]|uniref:Metal dependent phosphohydrolase n=1 Tax=Pseudobacteroides cellulosolvens ATCC 35603 = DSM 2933 TaxID=398512 RepID=A0A0L6JV79_9FIRM|nr:HD domain-containing phosphohydrolase [Pseudobacteroides cellulosolvens]KNY29332.1 metal dependent phosphohydrolase [Pseudobacteroides cellulosolvens ATCC 35603 = DSM 2933]